MSTIGWLLLVWAIVFAINVVPAFMPPSWSVMALFRTSAALPLLPLTAGGAVASAAGRLCLALLSRRFGRLLPETDRTNAEALGEFVSRHKHWRWPIVFGYCLGPFPSNPIFIASGVSRIPLKEVTVAFFISRLIADTFWVWTAGKVTGSLGGQLKSSVTSWQSILIQVVSIGLVVLLFRLPWAKWLGTGKGAQGGTGTSNAASHRAPAGSARKN